MLITKIAMLPTILSVYSPIPTRAPIAAVAHIVAAVVSPCTSSPFLKMIPAPRNPMPDTICATTRELSPPSIVGDIRQNRVEPRQISDSVRIPTDLPLVSRSRPITRPRPTESTILSSATVMLFRNKSRRILSRNPSSPNIFRLLFPQCGQQL